MTKVEIYYDFEKTRPVTDYKVYNDLPIIRYGHWFVFGNTSVIAKNTAIVCAYEKASVYAHDKAWVKISGSSRVLAWDSVKVDAHDNTKVCAREYAEVIASDNATVWVSNYAKAVVCDNATVISSGNEHDKAIESRERELICLTEAIERL